MRFGTLDRLAFPTDFDGFVYTDGASRGNPGPAAAGAVVVTGDGAELGRARVYLGRATNNDAEYRALLLGLLLARQLRLRRVCCRLDSELVVRQLNGRYKIKHPNLRELASAAIELGQEFERLEFVHVRRGSNQLADGLANAAIDEHQR